MKCQSYSGSHFYSPTSRSGNYAAAEILSEWPDAGSMVDPPNTHFSLWKAILYSTFWRPMDPSLWLHNILNCGSEHYS